jgi:hypothetical protein
MDHDRHDVSRPATRRAAGIMPVAVSLSNAPPTATRSSVMALYLVSLSNRYDSCLTKSMNDCAARGA